MKWLSDTILKWAMKHLFQGISIDDILLIKKGDRKDTAFMRGLEVPRERMLKLKEECEYFSNSLFWKEICDKNIRYTAQEMGMARKDGDLPLAQGMILDLNVLKKAIQDIQNFNIGK